MSAVTARRPPGGYGPPLLGKLLGTAEFFLFGWEGYFARRRRRRGTTVFKVNLFQPTIAVLDREGIAPLFADPDLIQDYGFSWAKPPLPLVGGVVPSVFEHGPAHDDPKAFILALLRERAPDLEKTFAAVAAPFFDRWTAEGAFGWADELEDLALSFVFEWILGTRPDVPAVRELYNNIFLHWAPWLERIWPGSVYARSVRTYAALVETIRSAPRFPQISQLAARFGLDAAALPHRLAFLLGMNSFLGLQSAFKSIVGELSRNPELAEAIRTRAGREPELIDRFVWETLRLHPPVFFIFGRAVRARELQTASGCYSIQAGELVMGVIPFAQRDVALFADPDRFDPARYDDPQARAGLIWSRGVQDAPVRPADKTCPGKDPALTLGRLFCARLAQGYRWRLSQPPRWSRGAFNLNIAAPVGALQVGKFEAAG
jgi:cytochrome P450